MVRDVYYHYIKGQVDGRFLLLRNWRDFPLARRIGEIVAFVFAAMLPAFFLGIKALFQPLLFLELWVHWILISIYATIYYFRGPLSIKAKLDPSHWTRIAFELAFVYAEVEFWMVRELLRSLSSG